MGTCPARWFFEHEARAVTPTSAAMGFGGLLHQLAHEVATGAAPADVDALLARLDRVWSQLAYDAPWESAQQRAEARAALDRFCRWHAADRGRRAVATEVPFEATVSAGGRDVVLVGRIDRVEVDRDGRVHVVDFKTGKNPPPTADLARLPQLGVYQLAVRSGALAGVDGIGDEPALGGAELVHVRCEVRDGGPKTQEQPALATDDDGTTWVERLLTEAVARIVGEAFPATPSAACERCPYRGCCPAQPAGRRVIE
jgi:RecB family exonuclease